MLRRATAAVFASLLGHGVLVSIGLGAASLREAEITKLDALPSPAIHAVASITARVMRIEGARRALVEKAREDRRKGSLSLGRFLLQANAIDAEERGLPFDEAEAISRFEERASALREALK